MPTLEFDKDYNDIEDPELLEEDWYLVQIFKDPTLEENKKKTGQNLVLRVKTVSDLPEENGRMFTIWMPFPGEADKEEYDGRGMLLYDKKFQAIADLADVATGCDVDGNRVDIRNNATFGAYIERGLDQNDQPSNSIDSFKGFKSPDDMVIEEEDDYPGE